MTRIILHYELGDKIGHGGMGEVYLARDTRLDREVAIKFVPEAQTADEQLRARFEREARAASKLTHQNIVAIHSFERADGRAFIVMEYVPGKSLHDVIKEGDLSLEHALRYAREIADALHAAHAQGVVHRDIKPDNVVITEAGHAKVLDFGLATIEGTTRITATSTSVGTLAYMSPEQLQGGDVDHRTDLFALGVLLYEMIAGRLPFEGEHQAAITYSILNMDPEPLARFKANIPDGLQRITEKSLRKDKTQRFQSAADFKTDISALTTQPPSDPHHHSTASATATSTRAQPVAGRGVKRFTPQLIILFAAVVLAGVYAIVRGPGSGDEDDPETAVTSSDRLMIAVLPFENLGSAEDEYFADGVTEEITARLASITSLGVIARTSVLRYKETDLPIGDIGEELGVDYILEGTVRWQRARDGVSDVRVTPQLIKVADETHVWADVYEQPLDAVFRVQTEIARQVIEALDVHLGGSESEAVARVPTDNVEAYDAYLRGVHIHYSMSTREHADQAVALFEKAVELDPNFAEAHRRLSGSYSAIGWYFGVTEETKRLSEQYARKAVEIDPGSYPAKMAWGFHLYHSLLDYDGALEEFNAAVRIRPSSAEAILSVGLVQRRQGKWDECVAMFERALALDPRSPYMLYEMAETKIDMRRYDEAQRYLDRCFVLDEEYVPAIYWQFNVHLLQGDLSAARRVADRPGLSAFHADELVADVRTLERDYDGAIDLWKSLTRGALDNHFVYYPIDQYIGKLLRFAGDPEGAKSYFESSLARLEGETKERPDDARLYGAMGITLAGLGRNDEAIAAAKKGVEMFPVSKGAKRGPIRLRELAEVYTMVGEYELALDQLEYLLTIPASFLDVELVKLQPEWDPLRDQPRFKKLIGE